MPLSNFHKTYFNKKHKTLPIVLFVLSLFIILLISIGVKYYIDNRSKASINTPENINIGNISTSSLVITWITRGRKSITTIMWGTNPHNLNQIAHDERDSSSQSQTRYTHIVKLQNLSPNTTYYYRIIFNEETFPDSNQPPFKIKTLNLKDQNISTPKRIYGDIPSTAPINDTLIGAYITQNNTACIPSFSYPNSDRTWYIDISTCIDLNTLKPVNISNNANVNLFIQTQNGMGNKMIQIADTNRPITITPDTEFMNLSISGSTLLATDINTESNSKIANNDTKPTINVSQNTTNTPTPTNTISSISPTPVQRNYTELPSNTPQNIQESHSINNYNLTEPYQLPPPVLNHLTTGNYDITLEIVPSTRCFVNNLKQGVIGNVTENSFTIIWYTQNKIPTSLTYKVNDSSFMKTDDRDNDSSQNHFLHKVTLKHLQPEQLYRLEFNDMYKDFTTPKSLNTPPSFNNISGEILNATGECFITYKIIKQSTKEESHQIVNVVGPSSYKWNINLGSLRTKDLNKYWNIEKNKDIIVINILCIKNENNVVYKEVQKALKDINGSKLIISL